MWTRYRLEIIAVIGVLCFCALFLATTLLSPNAEFGGSDDAGVAQITNMTGIPEEQFTPLVWQWAPPGLAVESTMFSVLAATGGILVGFGFGYWAGRKGDR